MPAGNSLIVYNLMQAPRSTIDDHLRSFRRYGRARYFYLNMAVRDVPGWLLRIPFDAVIFHTSFLSQRWTPQLFRDQLVRAQPLKGVGDVRVALPQDEFIHADLVSGFIEEFAVDHVFSVSPQSEWEKIYPSVDRDKVAFHPALTGYLSEDTVGRIDRIVAKQGSERPIDLGYRAWEGAFWLGRHGMLKRWVAERVSEEAPGSLKLDISTDDAGTFHGDDWFRFLARCKYTIGVEGGATVLDRDGSLKERTEAYVADHPGAGYDEVEAACFPGRDGELSLFAVSPRHLEACATRTCQVLVEGDYSGVLRPGEHYLELRRDLSNLGEVLDQIVADDKRVAITDAAYRDVVASGRYGYARFVAEVEAAIASSLGAAPERAPGGSIAVKHRLSGLADSLSAIRVRVTMAVLPRVARAANAVLPPPAMRLVRRLAAGRSAGAP